MTIVSGSRGKYLTPAELDRLFSRLRRRCRSRVAYTAAVLMLNLGLRVTEARTILVSQVSKNGRSIKASTLKRRTRAVRHTHEVTKTVAGVVLDAVRNARFEGSPWLLPSPGKPSSPISSRSIQRAIAHAAKHAGLGDRKVTPHTLRHSRAMLLWNATGDSRLVAYDLRHADPRSAEGYIHADEERYREAAAALPSIV